MENNDVLIQKVFNLVQTQAFEDLYKGDIDNYITGDYSNIGAAQLRDNILQSIKHLLERV